MKIAIVGAGISGISTALALTQDGHQVTVYEQMNAVAEDASFAPGGWLAPIGVQSFCAPGIAMPLSHLKGSAQLLQAKGWIGSATWRWLQQWKRNEKQASASASDYFAQALHELAIYSQKLRQSQYQALEAASEYQAGALILLRSDMQAQYWISRQARLAEQGIQSDLLTRAHTQAIEPSLGQEIPYSHALRIPSGATINPRLWAQHLRLQAQEAGATFATGQHVQRIHSSPLGVQTVEGVLHYEHIVICTGASFSLAADIALPVMPIWGYSVTAPIRDALHAPRHAIMDWQEQATITRMGQRIRITAGLEMGSDAHTAHDPKTLQRIYQLLSDWLPGCASLSSPQVQVWRGARGTLPDGLPAVGPCATPGVWLNLGHGNQGFSLASGCARALADMLQQKSGSIDMQAFHPLRFSSS